ncbi:MAG TPA: IS630 family transposase [Desulfobacterales bacterium]|nr:IS630 family transposase [Desulfobacterales bacterium]
MPFQRKRSPLKLEEKDVAFLENLSTSRTEPYAKVKRARILLAYAGGESISGIARREQTNRPAVERCVDKALSGGVIVALQDLARSGRPAKISDEDKAWVIHLACGKPTDYGYAAERWTIGQLAKHIRQHATENGYPALARMGKSGLHKILTQAQIKPHKTTYYLERRDEEFESKMAQVLLVYKEVQQIRESDGPEKHTVLSYDEKPGIQAIANIAADLAPVAGKYSGWARDHQYKRHGTLSLLAGIDLYDGHILSLVREKHRSKEFIEFLDLTDNRYPSDWRIRIILDNHSSHISKETMKWLKSKPNRFEFIYTPKHGSWLNLIEMFFSKMTRAFLRSLRVSSKNELKTRLEKYIEEVNADPVVFKWKYKMDEVIV